MARSLNRVQLIGNLTRDPELRYTPSGIAVCSFSIATNRGWTTDTGEKREETEFHNIVAWSKLAELCSQFLVKGRKAYVEGRLATRSWTAQDGAAKNRTEVVIDNMILLDQKRQGENSAPVTQDEAGTSEKKVEIETIQTKPEKKEKKDQHEDENSSIPTETENKTEDEATLEDVPDDIPF